jgi:hypothetical protein
MLTIFVNRARFCCIRVYQRPFHVSTYHNDSSLYSTSPSASCIPCLPTPCIDYAKIVYVLIDSYRLTKQIKDAYLSGKAPMQEEGSNLVWQCIRIPKKKAEIRGSVELMREVARPTLSVSLILKAMFSGKEEDSLDWRKR